MVAAGVLWLLIRFRRAGRRLAVAMATLLLMQTGRGEDIILPAFDPVVDAADVTNVAFRGAFPAPLWTSYALTDALFWQRDNQTSNRPLIIAVDGAPTTVITTRDLQFPVSEGVRAFYGQRDPNQGGWELGYWGVWGQSATAFAAATPPDFLQMPDPLGGLMTIDGETATVKYNSLINSAEANLFTSSTEWRDHSGSWMTVDWLAGFRYVGVEESASITTECCFAEGTSISVPYAVRTRNNGFGAQIGNRTRWTWERWALEGWAKAGLLGNAQEQIQSPLIDFTGTPQRQAISTTGGQVSLIGDINTSLVYRLTDVWGLRVGYNLIWIDGLALAPNQFDFSVAEINSGTRLVSGGGIFMHGANLGLEARW
ncbi:MAG: BBP7 family outer membrane beta-barrel protein [Planctomycetia bacterium]|nr:BBP7 family outer membrane beta-barrel protein [Planctomycetia bacterium]